MEADEINPSTEAEKLALVNAQSVRNRTALLLSDYVTSNNIDIACITETWLTQLDNVDIAVLQGNNYTLSHVMRDNIRGGGVGVLFKSTYKLLRSTSISCEAYEGINITLKHPNSTLITVVVIYRSPSLSMGSFFERFNGVLQETFVHGNMLLSVAILTYITTTPAVNVQMNSPI